MGCYGCFWVHIGKHAEYFISKCLADILNILKIQSNIPEQFKAAQDSPGLRALGMYLSLKNDINLISIWYKPY